MAKSVEIGSLCLFHFSPSYNKYYFCKVITQQKPPANKINIQPTNQPTLPLLRPMRPPSSTRQFPTRRAGRRPSVFMGGIGMGGIGGGITVGGGINTVHLRPARGVGNCRVELGLIGQSAGSVGWYEWYEWSSCFW